METQRREPRIIRVVRKFSNPARIADEGDLSRREIADVGRRVTVAMESELRTMGEQRRHYKIAAGLPVRPSVRFLKAAEYAEEERRARENIKLEWMKIDVYLTAWEILERDV